MSRTVHSEPDRTPSLGSLDAVGAVPQSSGDLPDGAHSVHLASRARDGDREALNSLLSLHEGWLRRVAGVLLGARVRRKLDSMDVVQEVSLLAIERIATLRTTDPASVRRWLTTILERRVKDMVQGLLADRRDVRREVPMVAPKPWESTSSRAPDPMDNGTRPDEAAAKLDLRELLDVLVSELPETQRTVVLMRDYEHADWDQVAAGLDRSVGAVQLLYQRAWISITAKAARRGSN